MKQRQWFIILGMTFLLGVPIIYEYNPHPLLGFSIAFLFSYLVEEDARIQLIDMRVAIGLAFLLLVWRPYMWSHFLFFYLFFKSLLWGMVKFEPIKERHTLQMLEGVRKGCKLSFVPFLYMALLLILSADMIYQPWAIVEAWAQKGNVVAEHIVMTHEMFQWLTDYLNQENWLLVVILVELFFIAVYLYLRLRNRSRQGYRVLYPFGDGDPLVLASLACLVGSELFVYAVLMLSIVLAESCKLLQYVKVHQKQKG